MATPEEQAKIDAEEKAAKETEANKQAEAEAAVKQSQQIKVGEDGSVTLNADQYRNMEGFKTDMHKFKDRAKTAEAELEKINAEKLESDKKALESQNKFQELYEKEKASNEANQILIEEQAKANAIELASVKAGITKTEYIKLIDKSKVTRDPDSKEFIGIDKLISAFKEENPNLFASESTTAVDTTQGGAATGVLSDDDVRKMGSKQIKEANANNKPLYDRWLKLCQQGKQ